MSLITWRRAGSRGHPIEYNPAQKHADCAVVIKTLRWAACVGLLLLLGWAAVLEVRTSFVQAQLFARWAKKMTYTVSLGPNRDIRFPRGGPYDERQGYTKLPSFVAALRSDHFSIARQAKLSPAFNRFIADGGYAIYNEKARTGLTVLDRSGSPLYAAAYPERIYTDFNSIPPVVINTLLFLEDRSLLQQRYRDRNPAIDWKRFLVAATGRFGGWFDPDLREGGASTLATQIEKFRHSPGGLTPNALEKLRQMATASLRAYLDGRNTISTRRQIVIDYLNSIPLSARPDFGETIGIGDGLWAWYGTDFARANSLLSEPPSPADLVGRAEVYRQVLSLLLANRRPSYYLLAGHRALTSITDRYLHLLSDAGVISPTLRDAALGTRLHFRDEVPPTPVSFVGRKAANTIRKKLSAMLQTPDLYSLDRLDLTVETTFDANVQQRVTNVLARLSHPNYVRSLGLVGPALLDGEEPAKVHYSVVLYERGAHNNEIRVHADSLNEPFDINSGAKLMLGSTAKLRTLVTYLDVIADLHRQYRQLSAPELRALAVDAQDPLTRWACAYLATISDRGLQAMLDAAMARHYSASPDEEFYTGGGPAVFHNFDEIEDHETPTVTEAFERSINLAFIRLMRDLTRYYIAKAVTSKEMLDPKNAARTEYLARFADTEGRQYIDRFYADYHGLGPNGALAMLSGRTRPSADRLAVIFRSVLPKAGLSEFGAFFDRQLPTIDYSEIARLYTEYAPNRWPLNERARVAGLHPLELWLAAYLQAHPGATRAEVLQASAEARQEAYEWLFKTTNSQEQDLRIKTILEEDAFDKILRDWRAQGYPFGHLVPSLATAIGSSGDRPEALAELIGIILDGGVKMPTVDINRMHFAAGTPYDTEMVLDSEMPQRVLAPEVAATVQRALKGVVAHGTGSRAQGAYTLPDGSSLTIGGKTGTGDNQFDNFGPEGQVTASRTVDRTATFVFFLGDRFFGTITAYVSGLEAAQYHFTSALAVTLLKALAPDLRPLIDSSPEAGLAVAAEPSGLEQARDLSSAMLKPGATNFALELGDIIALPNPTATPPNLSSNQAAGSTTPSEGDFATTRGWLMQVSGTGDGTYLLEVAERPDPGAPFIVARVPEPDAVPDDQPELRQRVIAVRSFIKERLLYGKEPDQRGWPMVHRPYITLTAQLFFAKDHHDGSLPSMERTERTSSWELAPIVEMGFPPRQSAAHTPVAPQQRLSAPPT